MVLNPEDPFDERRVGVVEPGVERMRGQVGQVVGGEPLEGFYHRRGVLRQAQGIIVGLPFEPS